MSLQVHLKNGRHSKSGMGNDLSYFVKVLNCIFLHYLSVRRLHGRNLGGT